MAGRVPIWRRYLTFWGHDFDADLRDELAFHLDERARELIEAGWEPGAAREEARRTLGDSLAIVAECRRIDRGIERGRRLARVLTDARDDMWFASRQFRRYPKSWAVIMLTLVVGIAASTSLFAVVDGVLLKPLPYPQPDRLIRLTTWSLRGAYVHLRDRMQTMDVAAYYPAPREVTLSIDGRPARLSAAGVTSDLFQVLGVQPVLGRSFTAEEMRVGGPGITGGTYWRTYGVVILSMGIWQDYFGGSPNALGQRVIVEGVPHTVVGVMPASLNFPARNTALWFPHNIDPNALWAGNVATMIGRLRPGHSLAEARTEMRALMPTFAPFIPWIRYVKDYGSTADAQSLEESIVGNARRVLLILLAAVGVVLLVLSVNVANLLLARGVARHREMTTRAALGAGRARLARQVVVENLTAAIVSGTLGVWLSWAFISVLVKLLPADLPRVEQVRLDIRVILFALGISTMTGLAFGLLPALQATRAGRGLLARTRVAAAGLRERRWSSVLAALEFAFALVLVASAVLLLRSLWNLSAVDPGFQVERLVAARVSPPGLVERSLTERRLFGERLLERLRQAPGIESAALANAISFDRGLFGTVFTIEGRSAPGTPRPAVNATYLGVSQEYFATMRTPAIEGRVFTSVDGANSPRVAVISRRLARAHWGDATPVGARIRFPDNRQFLLDAQGNEPAFTIVGVVGDVHFANVTGEAPPMVYLPLDQFWDVESLRLVMRTVDRFPALATTLQAIVSEIDRATPVSDIRTYQSRLGETNARSRFAAYLLAGFACVTLFLAAIGTYGVLSHAISRRLPEIGIRLAFGATGGQVFGLLLGHGLRLTAIGVVVGLPLTMASTRFLTALLFGVDPLDPFVLAASTAALLIAGMCASYGPARRAARIDPMVALRCE